MRRKDDSKKSVIVEYINEYYSDYGQTPIVRAISEGTGIAVATVHRYLLALKESGSPSILMILTVSPILMLSISTP
jgi:hypothetical protein